MDKTQPENTARVANATVKFNPRPMSHDPNWVEALVTYDKGDIQIFGTNDGPVARLKRGDAIRISVVQSDAGVFGYLIVDSDKNNLLPCDPNDTERFKADYAEAVEFEADLINLIIKSFSEFTEETRQKLAVSVYIALSKRAGI